jgi:RNA polymerase-binding transcription factor DksA
MDLGKVKVSLEAEKEKLEDELRKFHEEDPYLAEDRDLEVHSFDTDTVEDEAHDRIEGTRNSLKLSLSEVLLALEKLSNGTYGKCEKCGESIEPDRLEVQPAARYCMKHAQ